MLRYTVFAKFWKNSGAGNPEGCLLLDLFKKRMPMKARHHLDKTSERTDRLQAGVLAFMIFEVIITAAEPPRS